MTPPKFLGFYWTLPVPWAGFQSLPNDVDAAAKQSHTIRYQRDRVRRWVKDEGGILVAEEVFLELAPDRGSDQIVHELDRALNRCRKERATLVLVDFAEVFGWRRHGSLWDRLQNSLMPHIPLDPAPIFIDGVEFDPVDHFRLWRDIEHAHAEAKSNRKADLAKVIGQLAAEHESHVALTEELNARGVTTPTGKQWTDDNLRKFLKSA
jgi:hypothetical protein